MNIIKKKSAFKTLDWGGGVLRRRADPIIFNFIGFNSNSIQRIMKGY